MGKGKTGRKGDEGKSNGGRGGVGRRENEDINVYSIDMKSTLPIEVISSVDGGGGNFLEFCRFCNFVRTN